MSQVKKISEGPEMRTIVIMKVKEGKIDEMKALIQRELLNEENMSAFNSWLSFESVPLPMKDIPGWTDDAHRGGEIIIVAEFPNKEVMEEFSFREKNVKMRATLEGMLTEPALSKVATNYAGFVKY